MSTTYTKAPAEVLGMVSDLILEHYPELAEARVKFEVFLAHASTNDKGEAKGPALKLHGYPALATVQVVSYKNRVAGCKDVRIYLDGDAWSLWGLERKKALLDHEIFHCEIRRDKDGNIKSDDAGRPKLAIKPHDIQIGGFHEIAARHKEESLEVQQVAVTHQKLKQLSIDWSAACAAAEGGDGVA